MARNDDSQRKTDQQGAPAPRVYKAKDVHKRRAGSKLRSSAKDSSADEPKPAGETRETGGVSAAAGLDDSKGAEALPQAHAPADGGEGQLPPTADEGEGRLGAPGDDAEQPAAAADAEGQEPPDQADERAVQPPKERRKPKVTPKRIGFVLVGVLLIALVGFFSAFAWNRWGRYDDHADMQGQWYVVGTTVPVTIDETSIHLTDDVSYEYAIDDHDKTIRYTFGPMEGQGRYWFSDDRANFAITDGDGFTGAGNTFDDLIHAFTGFTAANGAAGARLPEGEGVIAFSREPGFLATMAKEAAERAIKRVEAQKEKEKQEAAKAAENAESVDGAETDAQPAGDEGADQGADSYYEDTSTEDTSSEEDDSATEDGESEGEPEGEAAEQGDGEAPSNGGAQGE